VCSLGKQISIYIRFQPFLSQTASQTGIELFVDGGLDQI
jgi:hypothetical protein